MGLDLYHYHATLKPEPGREGLSFRADEFDAEALEQLGFGRFLQMIPDTSWPCRIVIGADQPSLERASMAFKTDLLLAGFVGKPRDLSGQLVAFERQHGLDFSGRAVSLFYDMPRDCTSVGPDYGEFVSIQAPGETLSDQSLATFDWTIPESIQERLDLASGGADSAIRRYLSIRYPTPVDYFGCRTEEVGYQRKGMRSGFYRAFPSEFLRWRKADVEQALSFLDSDCDDDPEDDRRLVEHFTANFLDNFEEGRSIFWGSY